MLFTTTAGASALANVETVVWLEHLGLSLPSYVYIVDHLLSLSHDIFWRRGSVSRRGGHPFLLVIRFFSSVCFIVVYPVHTKCSLGVQPVALFSCSSRAFSIFFKETERDWCIWRGRVSVQFGTFPSSSYLSLSLSLFICCTATQGAYGHVLAAIIKRIFVPFGILFYF